MRPHNRPYLLTLGLWLLMGMHLLPAQVIPWTFEEIRSDLRQSGARPDVVLDAQGKFHVTYWQVHSDQLIYGVQDLSGQWTFENVPDQGVYGYTSALAVAPDGTAHLAYHHNDIGMATLRYAQRTPAGDWTVEVVFDSVDIGLYGLDPAYPTHVQPSLDISLNANGEPEILYFNGEPGTIGFCAVASILDSYYGYEMNMNLAIRQGSGWVLEEFTDVPYLGTINCLDRGERFGEFGQLIPRADGEFLALTTGMHNHELLMFRDRGNAPAFWDMVVLDSASRYLNNLNFFETFSFPHAILQEDTILHVVSHIARHHGAEGSANSRQVLVYQRFHPDSVFQPGYEPTRVTFPGTTTARFFPRLTLVDDSTLSLVYYNRTAGLLVEQISSDGGDSWAEPDTFLQTLTQAPIQSWMKGDSLYVFHYDRNRDGLRVSVREADQPQTWETRSITQSEENGQLLSSEVIRNGSDDELYVAYTEGFNQGFFFETRIGGVWDRVTVLDGEQNVNELHMEITESGTAFLAYTLDDTLKPGLSIRSNGNWQHEDIPTLGPVDGLSLFLEETEILHIACYLPMEGHLVYGLRTANGTWNFTVVDSSSAFTGKVPSIALDDLGNPQIAYYDGANIQLKYAYLNATGDWERLFITDPQQRQPVGIQLQMADGITPLICIKDSRSDSLFLYEPGPGGVLDAWTFSPIPIQQSGASGFPFSMELDDQARPWILYNFSAGLDEVRLVRLSPQNTWEPVSVLANTNQISNIFDLHIVEKDLYIIGQENLINSTGIGYLLASQGIALFTETIPSEGIRLAPNPASDQIEISWETPLNQKAEIRLYNPTGQQVYLETVSPNLQLSHTLSLTSFPPGIYLCQLQIGSQSWMTRLIHIP